MADYGLTVLNQGGAVVIDSTYVNLNIVQRGVCYAGQRVYFSENAVSPLVFLKIPGGVGMNNSVCGLVHYSAANPRNSFGYSGRYNGAGLDPTAAALEYALCTIGPPASPPTDTYGLKVWNAAGQLCFNSMYNQPKIVKAQSIDFDRSGNVMDIVMPDASQDFWISVPLGGLLADSWYDQVEYMDIHAVSIGWIAANVMRVVLNVQYQYELGWGGMQVTHNDCFAATVTAVIAKI